MTPSIDLRARVLTTAVLLTAACSSGQLDSSPYPYKRGTTNVIGADTSEGSSGNMQVTSSGPSVATDRVGVGGVMTVVTPDADACIEINDMCAKPQDSCGKDGTADVIVAEDGSVLSVICYPNHDYKVVEVGDAATELPDVGNNAVVVLDSRDDGVDIEGDVHVKGNNVIIYGAGPETSEIGGDLILDKNNAIVRGVRVDGDVDISKNNASLVDCIIEGNLRISGNNVSLALCQIWGRIEITGKNTVLVSNLVLGEQAVSGDNLRCNDNHRFADTNGDGSFQDDEVAAPVVCQSRGMAVTDTTDLSPKK